MKVLIVVDVQYDFLYGSLTNRRGKVIAKRIADYISTFDGGIILTRDIHIRDYLADMADRLPAPHPIYGGEGMEIVAVIADACAGRENVKVCEKSSYGLLSLGSEISDNFRGVTEIELAGICTSVCVLSNALILRSALPDVRITVLADMCACVSEQSHYNALKAMRECGINIISNEADKYRR